MTAKQSAAQVTRGRVRRALRAELAARCAVFNDHPDDRRAALGWVEIQRNDSIDAPLDVEPFYNDEHAALAVAELGGAPGCAMHYETGSGLFEPVEIHGTGTTPERRNALDLMCAALDDPEHAAAPSWIVVVPRSVAIAAGLECEAE